MNLHESHFRMLRLAILRQPKLEQVSADEFTVQSRSNPRHAHTVNPVKGSCCCPAFDYCYHLAYALDRWMEREAGLTERGDYLEARRVNFGMLPLRDDLPRDDKRYLAACVEQAREKYAALFVTVGREWEPANF